MKSFRPPDENLKKGESIDGFLDGSLKVIQSKQGYRFSIDSILLSQFVTTKYYDRVIDLGTGCGIIPLILLSNRSISSAIGLEIQPSLASQAIRNASLNNFKDKMGVILADIKDNPIKPRSAELVICNPPYRPKNSGRLNPDPERAIARHELLVSIEDILEVSGKILKPKGRLALAYPAVRTADLLARLRRYQFEAKRMRVVYPDDRSEAKTILVEATLGGRPGIKLLPPLFDQGDYSI